MDIYIYIFCEGVHKFPKNLAATSKFCAPEKLHTENPQILVTTVQNSVIQVLLLLESSGLQPAAHGLFAVHRAEVHSPQQICLL
jgi:hypothetical protein